MAGARKRKEATVELTAKGRRALAASHGRGKTASERKSGTSPQSRAPAARPRSAGARPAANKKCIAIVSDSTEGATSLICGIDTLPLEMAGMGAIYYCTYCGQTFHESCIREYRRYSSKCPNPLCPSIELGVPFEVKELR